MKLSSSSSDSGIFQAIATLSAIVATLGVNSWSNFRPPGGLNVGQISNTIFKDVLIIPASYAFAIWGVIYIGLLSYGVYQLQPPQRKDWSLRHVNRYLIAACLIQVGWIYCFTLRWFWLSVIAMLGILVTLILAYESLGVGRVNVNQRRRWLAHIPFSLYLAWISVATIVNVACALFATGLQSYGTVWTMMMLIVGGGLAATIVLRRLDTTFVLVFAWAYGAIALRHPANPWIMYTALGVAIVIIGQRLLMWRVHSRPRLRTRR